VQKYGRARQATSHGACALHAGYLRLQTHSEYVILIASQRRKSLSERAPNLRLEVNCQSFFFKEIYCTEKSVKYTRLQNCSLNQFAIVVTRRVSDRVSTVIGSYKCSSEKQVQKKNTAAFG